MDKKRIFLWSLYDFANSIVFINFLLYFSQWLVLDGGLSDFWYNTTFAVSTILLFLSAPILAGYTDKFGKRKFFLVISTFGTAICYATSVLFSFQNSNIFLIALFFLLGQYFYQLSFVFYNPLIEEISDEEHRGRVSGIGQFSNAIGQVVGLAIMLPLSGSRLAPLLPSIGIFIMLSLPFIIWYKENDTLKSEYNNSFITGFYKKLIPFFSLSMATPLLVAFFFYNDALVTVTNNYSIYMQQVFGIPDSQKSLLLMLIVVMNAAGGLLSGWLGDKYGIEKTLKMVLVFWIIALPAIALTSSITIFIILTAILGLLIGSMWAISRAYMSVLLAKDNLGLGFSFYTILERFSTLVGPLTWGIIISSLGTESSAYRIAIASMAIFVLIGFLTLTFWRKDKKSS
ncbi:MAG: MFS transporter [Bacteroidetes bacterium]|nr:MAG: MFS transporter [Bacteroidota bacterium]